jgi:hypothetical protein
LHVHVLHRAALIALGNFEHQTRSRALVDEALATAEATGSPPLIAMSRIVAGRVLANSADENEREHGVALLEETLTTYGHLGVPFYESQALAGIVRAHGMSGDPRAWPAFRAAFVYFRANRTPFLSSTLVYLVHCLLRVDRHEPAAIITGWVFAHGASQGFPTLQNDRDLLLSLTDHRFHGVGAAMTEAEIIAFALAEVERSNEFDPNDVL